MLACYAPPPPTRVPNPGAVNYTIFIKACLLILTICSVLMVNVQSIHDFFLILSSFVLELTWPKEVKDLFWGFFYIPLPF